MTPILTLLFCLVGARQAQLPSAETVLSQVNERYLSLSSYTDWGTITFSYRSATGERRGDMRLFNTGFQRPNHIRYEFVEPASDVAREKRWVTWTAFRSGYATWTNWLPNEVDRVSLQKSLFRSWGMSESCGIALKLLVPWALDGARATGIYKTSLSQDTVEGHPTWRIDGVCENGAEASVWVDPATHLIVKYKHAVDAKLDGKPTNEIYTVVLHPSANPHMTDSALRFLPPQSGSSNRHVKKSRHKRRHR